MTSGTKATPAGAGPPDRGSETLLDHFRTVLPERPEAQTYRFLPDGEGEPQSVTNAELDLRARALAAQLSDRFGPGERALIVCQPGLDYVTAFFACLYSGLIAVPVYPPNPALLKRTLPRLLGVIDDARPSVVLAQASVTSMAGSFAEFAPALGTLDWIAIDEVDLTVAQDWRRPEITGASTAFLQYTSGSTGQPKGVVVSHANLLHNLDAIHRLFVRSDAPEESHLVIWLPPYHDMGLIGGLLEPAYGGFPVTFMSPLAFLKRPIRWLRAISEQRGTYSGAPNFAYDLCVAKTTEEERATLDLSRWTLAFTGAEPVRAETVERFARAFAPSGFHREALYPCYGLAEGTLLVSGGERAAPPVIRRLDAVALAGNTAVEAAAGQEARLSVSCGASIPGQELLVVDPEALTRLPDGRVGEIWVSGPSVAAGYWQRPEETGQTFGGRPAGPVSGPFLRTGDLGFLDGGELHVTGRRKDLIIVAGRNHYPQDIERTVEGVDPALRPGCGVACAVERQGEERLLVVHEVDGPGKLDTGAVIVAIRAAVAAEHDLVVHEVVLVRRGAVPKTSSGKVQRAACREAFLAGSLDQVAGWSLVPPAAPSGLDQPVATAPAARTRATPVRSGRHAEAERWLREEVAERLGVAPDTLDPTVPMASYGLASVDMVGVVGGLERRLDRTLSATLAWEYPTIDALADFLAVPDGTDPGTPPAGIADPVVDRPGGAGRGAPAAAWPQPGPAEPVAIVGVGCRFPGGADSPAAFWRLLCEGRDTVTEVPPERWKVEDSWSDDPATPGRTTTRWGAFLDGVDGFDPQFFGISQHEAARMDPQQRLLAEVSWEALEDAGMVAEHLAGSATGVFVGIATNDYGQQFQDFSRIDAYTGTGNALSIAANRLSYLFDLRGPSMSIDTACSSSLVAVHQACRSLARGDCSLALAGGVNLVLSPALAINFSKAGAMASDGRCKAFDARADGYVRAEGAGMVVLKPLSRALADRDSIYGVIRGVAINQDGRTNGLMAPNPHAQQAVLRSAYADAGLSPAQVHYVEAHGTGTLLGDPIEAKALAAVVAAGRDAAEPCLIGSVKSNLGHLEAAAGIAGLIKVALMVRHRTVPASLHFHRPNPHIPFQDLSLRVADVLQQWPSQDGPAIAGVSSFGFGGTNAHVVVEEAPQTRRDPVPLEGRAHLLTVSARTEQALQDLAARYGAQLDEAGDDVAADGICLAASVRRTHHEHRLACVGASTVDLRDALAAFAAGEERPGLSVGRRRIGRRPAVVFLFSGQGPRWWPVGADLLEAEPVFRETLEHCDAVLRREAGWSLLGRLASGPDDPRLADPAVAQPALCAVQVALAALWRSWGVEPAAVVGHSVGEVAAAHVAGALDLPDALRVALHRGRVIRSATGNGRMAVAGLSYARAQQVISERGLVSVSVAASNGPNSTVLSGESAALTGLVAELDAGGIFCRVLESVDFASHSPQMDPVKDELRKALAGLTTHPAAVPIVSTVTGGHVDGADLGADYWAANLRRPVLFDQAVTALIGSGHDTFVEISPHPMVGDAVAERMSVQEAPGAVVASLRRDEPARTAILAELGRLYTAGFPVDWPRVHGRSVPMLPLPSYPWQRQRCWLDDEYGRRRSPTRSGHPILQTFIRSAAEPRAHHWSAEVGLDGFPFLRDHQVDTATVLPASLVLDAALAAAQQVLGADRAAIEDVHLTRLTIVEEVAEDATLQLVLVPEAATTGSFRLFAATGPKPAGDWQQVADGRYRAVEPAGTSVVPPLLEVRDRCRQAVPVADHYTALSRAGLQYGPAFQGVAELWRGDREAVARLRDVADLSADRAGYVIHPALLDSCLQVLAAAADPSDAATYLPVTVGRLTVGAGPVAPRWAYAVLPSPADGQQIEGARVVLFGDGGEQVAEIDGVTLRRLDADGTSDRVADSLLELDWHEVSGAPEPVAELDPAAGWWLLLADRGGSCESLRSAVQAAGGSCVTVTAGADPGRRGPDRYELDPCRSEGIADLLAELRAGRPEPCAGVVHAWSLDAALPPDAGPADDALWRSQDLAAVSVLHLVQALTHPGGQPARLVLLTRGAQRVGDETTLPAPAQGALWGLARVIMLEHGELHPTVVDLDPAGDGTGSLPVELLRPGGDQQLALRGERRYVPRLRPWRAPGGTGTAWERRRFDARRDANTRVLAEHPGILDSLTPTSWQRTPPGPGEVEIEVAAAGLNFSDVLKALDSCPGVPPGITPLGAECAGQVTAVGSGVERFRVGDPVMAVASSSMARYVTTPEYLVAPRPAGLTDEEAAATPVAFLTAVHGLEHLAHLGRGETVLIHSATGGVGLAALQVARRNGARVFATAGTEQKREMLRRLGVEHVFDSRTLRFAAEIRLLTGGRGVDVVLNSLTGEALTHGLSLVAPNGRFVEIGKQDVYADSHVSLGFLKHNRSFFAVDLERSFAEQPALIGSLWGEVVRGFETGEFTALPVTSFPFSRAAAAFSLMAQARHTGKVVLRPEEDEVVAVRPGVRPVRPAATYLITGGLGALGLRTAQYLVDSGARHLVLLGRRQPSAAAEELIDELRSRSVEVRVVGADIARHDDVAAVLADIDAGMPPLAGIVHAAGVLDDGPLSQLDRERFRSVAAPKVAGAWHLHRATLGRDLDFFLMFSSAAALLGSPGQGNYAAANAFLDGLAQHRRMLGLAALSIDWGPWSEAGLATGAVQGGQLSARGILSITPDDGIEALDRLLRTTSTQASVLPLDRAGLAGLADVGLLPELLAEFLVPADRSAAGGPEGSAEVRQRLLAVQPGRRRRTLLTEHCVAEAARVLRTGPSSVDTTVPLASMGFDSLMALELRKRLELSLGVALPATVAWRFPTIDVLVPFLAERMGVELAAGIEGEAPPAEIAEPSRDDGNDLDGLDGLDDSEIEALLLTRMTQIDGGH